MPVQCSWCHGRGGGAQQLKKISNAPRRPPWLGPGRGLAGWSGCGTWRRRSESHKPTRWSLPPRCAVATAGVRVGARRGCASLRRTRTGIFQLSREHALSSIMKFIEIEHAVTNKRQALKIRTCRHFCREGGKTPIGTPANTTCYILCTVYKTSIFRILKRVY